MFIFVLLRVWTTLMEKKCVKKKGGTQQLKTKTKKRTTDRPFDSSFLSHHMGKNNNTTNGVGEEEE